MLKLEEVFKISGVPTYTFVEPQEYTKLVVSLRTPGRGLVIEGPSGIGKTTAVGKALESIGLGDQVTKLSARKKVDVEYIEALPTMEGLGVVIVDDFQRLSRSTRQSVADHLKVLADEGKSDSKLVILGINRAGERLIEAASDLANRVDIITFEANPEHKTEELLRKGENALNIELNVRQEIVEEASGSFYIAQMLAHEVCVKERLLHAEPRRRKTEVSFEAIKAEVWDRLGLKFRDTAAKFCRGTKMKREGRAPYLHILNWLATGKQWSVNLKEEIRRHAQMRGSVGQVVDKGFLKDLVRGSDDIESVLHYDDNASQLTVNDPQFVFYIRNIPWNKFARDLGYISVEFSTRYDFALSFAGEDREVARALFDKLSDSELEVFYDQFEQHRILAEDVEEYLRPIYQSEARFVVCLLGPSFPTKVWTKFESDAFRVRFGDGAVIPVWFSNAPPGVFDESRRVGGLSFDPARDLNGQIEEIASLLLKKGSPDTIVGIRA